MGNQSKEAASEDVITRMRSLDNFVRDEARRIHVEHCRSAASEYQQHALNGAYDLDDELCALRAAIRRGIEIGKADTNMIAAATNMYAALEQVEGRVSDASSLFHNSQRWHEEEGRNGEPSLWDWVFAPTRTAIAKAREQSA